MNRMMNHPPFAPLATLAAGAVFLLAALGWIALLDTPAPRTGAAEVRVEKGMTAGEIAHLLKRQGVIRSAFLFRVVSRVKGYDGRMWAGLYTIPAGLRTSEIARLLTVTVPKPIDIKVTVIEGLTIAEIASLLELKAKVDSAAFTSFAMSGAVAESMGIDNKTLEGYLYPDTYFIAEGAKAFDVIRRMTGRFREVFNDSLAARAGKLGFSLNDVLTLASLIETEAVSDEERPIISSVFHHRLKAGLPLQANPSVQYALGVKRRVYNGDLDVDSPYNTYLHRGLPPGPIANPGMKSILAALYPADTKYLYFVSNGSGGHVFSRTLSEHNTAVARYMKQRAHRSR